MAFVTVNSPGRALSTGGPQINLRPEIQPRARVRRSPDQSPVAEPVSLEPQPASKPDYDVGYGKPPKDTQFKKGKSGNPNGRPKGSKCLKTIVRAVMEEKVSVKTRGRPKKMARVEALVRTTSDRAFAGDLRSTQTLLQHYGASVLDDTSRSQAPAISIEDQDVHDKAILAALLQSLRDQEDDE